jgi:hypothetical protein
MFSFSSTRTAIQVDDEESEEQTLPNRLSNVIISEPAPG